eukprot:m.135878 g.135878  ORF g.135878 m.135878 type:complete len:615 (-) comp10274_c0_seq1:190-2034(-)
MTSVDPSSAALNDAVCTHFSLDVSVDFFKHQISGKVTHTVHIRGDDVRVLHLDNRGCDIDNAVFVETGEKLEVVQKPTALGSDVSVYLPSGIENGSEVKVQLEFSTDKDATAVQWLDTEQTQDKTHAFMFSQCQAIHARSLVPCQDTPAHKCTYDARVRVEEGVTVLMSAEGVSDEVENVEDEAPIKFHSFQFVQKIAIPSYLLAIVAGHITSRDLSNRCRVWSEHAVIEKSAYEFEEVESLLQCAEGLLGEYEWGRYDMVVLPPSFPYGGMENPMLTFLTPTLLAGDRSLVNVVAHEIIHSWTGNMVTSASWEHFWLNEGFTVFCERKVAQRMEGNPARHLGLIEGHQHLQEYVTRMGNDHDYTKLCPSFDGTVDPDDVFSIVPYEKGSLFLVYIETLVGEKDMEEFLKAYVLKFRHKSITTDDFREFLNEFFASKKDSLSAIDWDMWLHAPGMPSVDVKFDNTLMKEVDVVSKELLNIDTDWENASWHYTLNCMQECVLYDALLAGDGVSPQVAKFLAKHRIVENREITFRVLQLCLKAGLNDVNDEVIAFLASQGRMKFVRPLYRSFAAVPGNTSLAQEVFAKYRNFYHNIASAMIAKDLGVVTASSSSSS